MKESIKRIIKTYIPNSFIVKILRINAIVLRRLKGKNKVLTDYITIPFFTKDKHTFFGYYDISPFGSDNRIIYHEVTNDSAPAKIVLNTLDNKSKQYVAETKAWNWQQGARLRWVPNQKDSIIFNDFKSGKFISRIINLKEKQEKELDYPLYDISSDGKIGLSLDFTRLGYKRPGYGYTNLPFLDKVDYEKEGIEVIDILKNERRKTISYSRIASKLRMSQEDIVGCYLNHLSFSPENKKFLFFFIHENNNSFHANLLVYDFENDELSLLEDKYKVSHYDWINENTIICTAYGDGRFFYFLYYLDNKERKIYCEDLLLIDGHPTSIGNHEIITDTYPNQQSYQKIYKVSEKTHSKKCIAQVFDWKVESLEKRTDLHPRVSEDGKYLSFDANTSGTRGLYILLLQ